MAGVNRRHFLASAAGPLLGCDTAREISGGFVGARFERGHVLRAAALPTDRVAMPRTRVLIVGGGVAGLAVARALRLRGMDDFQLLELEDTTGGNSRSTQIKGVACPLGAHYLPVPGDNAPDVQDLLEELGLRQRRAGRWVMDERHLCHSPQERLFFNGHWQEGLLPWHEVGAATLEAYRRFEQQVRALSGATPFHLPMTNQPLAPVQLALDAITFEAWLAQHQLLEPHLRWYLDYCCRDDYGAGISTVSAWAGIHYFASRHGFHAPSYEVARSNEAESAVLTWPEGNAWLTQRLAAPLGERVGTGRVVTRVSAGKHGVQVDAFNAVTQRHERWQADHVVMAVPLFIAQRVVESPPPALNEAVTQMHYAAWMVANVHIDQALHDRPGAAPSWDNVISTHAPGAGAEALGYVDAMHQSLQRVPGATVLTCYRALGIAPAQRQNLLNAPWTHWRDVVLSELSVPHPDVRRKATHIDVMRYGHAMSTPVPGVRSSAALAALRQPQPKPWQRLHFAHSDLAAYSVFEEAFTLGHRLGLRLQST